MDRGIAPSRVLDTLGVSRSAYSRWRRGGDPSNETIKLIADYFELSASELMSYETKKAPAQMSEDEEMRELLTEFRDSPELRTLFSLSYKATAKDLRKYIEVIKALRRSENGDYQDY